MEKNSIEMIDLLVADACTYIQSYAEELKCSYDESLIRIVGEHRTARRYEATKNLPVNEEE